jgi:hypothetical protein
MKRHVASPVEVQTTTCPPWLSDWIAHVIAQGRDPRPKLAAIRNAWIPAALLLIKGERHVLGYAFHCDTDDPHFDLCWSRQDGVGGRIGHPGLQRAGPWCVGVDRQVRVGANINAEKRGQLRSSVANFRRRYGMAAIPLDVALARVLDAAADSVLGTELQPFREAYAERVPELERLHALAQLRVIEAAREKLLRQSAPMPVPAPEMTLGR